MALYPLTRPQFFTDTGAVASGYQLFFYVNGDGGGVKQGTTDGDGGAANPNPIILDTSGRPDSSGTPIDIFFTNGATYTVILATSTAADPPIGGDIVWTVDDVVDLNGLVAEWSNTVAATRATTTTFTISGVNKTTEYHANRRVKLTGGADRYGRITASTFSTDTTVTVAEITDSSGVTATLHASMGTAEVAAFSANVLSPIYDYSIPSQTTDTDSILTNQAEINRRRTNVLDFMSDAEKTDIQTRAGTLDVSTALLAAYTACPAGDTLWFDDGLYLWDFQLVIAKSIHFRGSGAAEIKLPDQSTLFHLGDATRRPYMIYVQESDVSFKGIKFNGNSVTNFKDVSGTDRYNYTSGIVYSCGLIIVGWIGYNNTGQKNINNISITECEFIDSPHTGIDTLDIGFRISNYRVSNNYFEKCQDDQCSMTNVDNAVISHNTHTQPYNHGIHAYQGCDNINIHDNTIFFDSTVLTGAIVEYYIVNTTWVAFGIKIGKTKTDPVNYINVHDNNLNGCGIEYVQGANYTNVHHNNITGTQDGAVGINYQNSTTDLGDATTQYDITNPSGDIVRYTYNATGTDPGITATNPPSGSRIFTSGGTLATANSGYFDIYDTGVDYIEVVNATHTVESAKTTTIKWSKGIGNSINNNIVSNCYNPGIYLSDTYHEVEVHDNILIGNNTSTAQYGGRDCFANMFIISPFFMVERNIFKRIKEAPSYGINYFTGTGVTGRLNDGSVARQLYHFEDNIINNGGYISDFYDVDGNARYAELNPRFTPTTDKNFSLRGQTGDTKIFTYQNDTIADDGTVNLPDSTSGMAFVSCNAESGQWLIQNDGTCSLVVGTANTAATNTDNTLNIYDTGTAGRVQNRLGAVGEIRIIYYYN